MTAPFWRASPLGVEFPGGGARRGDTRRPHRGTLRPYAEKGHQPSENHGISRRRYKEELAQTRRRQIWWGSVEVEKSTPAPDYGQLQSDCRSLAGFFILARVVGARSLDGVSQVKLNVVEHCLGPLRENVIWNDVDPMQRHVEFMQDPLAMLGKGLGLSQHDD
jgi:hypothetical protein